ncbi:MAG TPA: OmpA family protein [Edaphocola sp.]|nr:OmpA family protein [Edaphocola sp.]
MKKLIVFIIGFFVIYGCTLSLNSCKPKEKIGKVKNSQKKKDIVSIYHELQERVAEGKVSREGDKVKLILPEAMLFEVYSTEVNSEYLPTLTKIAKIVNKYPETSILIMGYTDTTGSAELNNKLSWGRSENVKDALINNGIKNKRLYTWGFGSRNPIADNTTVEGRKQNRRVEFVILYDYQDSKNKK